MKQRSSRSHRIRRILIPLNLILATGMLRGLALGTPSVNVLAIFMVVATAASIMAVLIEN